MDKLEPLNLACNKIVQIPIEASVRYSVCVYICTYRLCM